MISKNTKQDLEELSAAEPPYRSAQEASIGRILDRYGIPFFYDQPMVVYDHGRHKVVRPAFTLPSYDGLVVEYLDGPRFAPRRAQLYQANGVAAVIVQPEDLTGFKGPADLLQRISKATEQYTPLDKCPAVPRAQPVLAGYFLRH